MLVYYCLQIINISHTNTRWSKN